MRFPRPKSLFASLRVRLSLWNTAVVLLTVVAALFGVREGLRWTTRHEIDQLLREDALELSLAVEQLYQPDLIALQAEMSRKVQGHAHRDLFVQLIDADGRIVWASPNTPSPDQISLPTADESLFSHDGMYRIAQRKVVASEARPQYTVRVGSSLATVDEDIAKLTQMMALVGLLILVVAPLGGYWLAGRATRPMAEINHTAERLRPSQMDERLPIRGVGDELDRLSTTINRFLDQIADYLDRNREFVANAAHELRSPLAAIQSSVEVALNADRTVPEYQDLLHEIVNQCSQLGRLVKQLLVLAESDAGRLDLESDYVRLDRVVARSLDMFRGAAEERGVVLESGRLHAATLRGDSDRLQQVVNNLIDNAVKFSTRGGKVLVELVRDDGAKQVRFVVADEGQGIPETELPSVFDRFYRGDKSRHRENQTAGSGLGLSICQSIVEGHGGRIDVESKLGHGTRMTVTLPRLVAESAPTADRDQPAISWASPT